jgi:hypothetical protein
MMCVCLTLQECFVTVYGDVPPEGSRKQLGVCGVCRQPMRMGDGSERRGQGKNSEYLAEYDDLR